MTLLRPRGGRNRKGKVNQETRAVRKMRMTNNTSKNNIMNFMGRKKLCEEA